MVFEGTDGMALRNTHTRLTGYPMEIAVSEEMLGRTFNGIGEPIDDLGPIVSKLKRDVNGLPLNPGHAGIPAKLYPNRNFCNRRTDHPDPWSEAAYLFRKWSSTRQAGCTDRTAGFSGRGL